MIRSFECKEFLYTIKKDVVANNTFALIRTIVKEIKEHNYTDAEHFNLLIKDLKENCKILKNLITPDYEYISYCERL